MPRIIPLYGATTVERVEENSKAVLLDEREMATIEEVLKKLPVKGHRWPPVLQQFADV